MNERWKYIEGYENSYQISNLGRVKSFKGIRGKEEIILKTKNKKGYSVVGLYKNSKRKEFFVHRLVALAFIPNPNNLPQINHIDENVKNNIACNLEWCSCKYNSNFGTRSERISKSIRGSSNPSSRKVICITTGETFDYVRAASLKYGISEKNISTCCRGRLKSAGKHPNTGAKMIWKYID